MKIKVPQGMQQAFVQAMQDRFGSVPGGTAVGLRAALQWLAENPIVPTRNEWVKFRSQWSSYEPDGVDVIEFFKNRQRRMFLDPEDDPLGDIIAKKPHIILSDASVDGFNEAIREAYRRGKASR